MSKSWLDVFARWMARLVPDAVTTSIILLLVLAGTAWGLGQSLTDTIDAYYRGLWMLLAFTMQMTLILVLSLVLAATPFFKKLVVGLSRLPTTATGVVVAACLCAAAIGYLNWGLGLALGPMIAIHFAKQAEAKGLAVDFLFLQATLAGAGSVWQFGLSASGPLLMATPGHFLEATTGVMPLATTIWSPAALVHVPLFLALTMTAGCLLMPRTVRRLSEFPASEELARLPVAEPAPAAAEGDRLSLAQRLERSPLVVVPLLAALGAWLYHHFFNKGLSLDINSLNTIFLLACFVLHRNVFRFTKALQQAISGCWPIVVMYHLYAGVAGLIQFTPVGEFLATLVAPISTPLTFPLLTALVSTVVAVFIPTSGGQWLIQGFVTVKAAEAVGASAQRGMLALGIGDHMGNLVSPFWAVVGANIARIDFRLVFGYRLIFAAIWFVVGVLVFTLLPC